MSSSGPIVFGGSSGFIDQRSGIAVAHPFHRRREMYVGSGSVAVRLYVFLEILVCFLFEDRNRAEFSGSDLYLFFDVFHPLGVLEHQSDVAEHSTGSIESFRRRC